MNEIVVLMKLRLRSRLSLSFVQFHLIGDTMLTRLEREREERVGVEKLVTVDADRRILLQGVATYMLDWSQPPSGVRNCQSDGHGWECCRNCRSNDIVSGVRTPWVCRRRVICIMMDVTQYAEQLMYERLEMVY